MTFEISTIPQTSANSQKLAVTAATVHSAAIASNMSTNAVITTDTDCYMRMTAASDTVVASDGTDQLLLAGNQYRVGPIPNGYYLHFIRKTADGSVHITPGG